MHAGVYLMDEDSLINGFEPGMHGAAFFCFRAGRGGPGSKILGVTVKLVAFSGWARAAIFPGAGAGWGVHP